MRSKRSPAVRNLFALLALAALAACGPIRSSKALIDADVEVEAARAAGAQKSAVYEYTAAEAYLHEARVQSGQAQFEASEGFAEKAIKLAQEARKKALAASNRTEEK
jgi:hypothetical protein